MQKSSSLAACSQYISGISSALEDRVSWRVEFLELELDPQSVAMIGPWLDAGQEWVNVNEV